MKAGLYAAKMAPLTYPLLYGLSCSFHYFGGFGKVETSDVARLNFTIAGYHEKAADQICNAAVRGLRVDMALPRARSFPEAHERTVDY